MGGGMGGFGQTRRPKKAKLQPDLIPARSRVVLSGLQSQPQLNGQCGTIQQWEDSAQRYTVVLESSGLPIALRPQNVHQTAQVTLQGPLASRSDLVGAQGTIVGWDEARQRYQVQLAQTGTTISVKPLNVILPINTRVCVRNLRNANSVKFNGQFGTIRDYDAQAGRYVVEMGLENAMLRVRASNAVC
jgi:hypothetical protein